MSYTVGHATEEGVTMAGLGKDPLGQKKALPPAAGGSISGHRVLMGILLLLIAVSGVAMAASSGQPTLAIAIGLIAAAFFCRVGC
jgi:hypothetical protein